jgi:hypothetical protein
MAKRQGRPAKHVLDGDGRPVVGLTTTTLHWRTVGLSPSSFGSVYVAPLRPIRSGRVTGYGSTGSGRLRRASAVNVGHEIEYLAETGGGSHLAGETGIGREVGCKR